MPYLVCCLWALGCHHWGWKAQPAMLMDVLLEQLDWTSPIMPLGGKTSGAMLGVKVANPRLVMWNEYLRP